MTSSAPRACSTRCGPVRSSASPVRLRRKPAATSRPSRPRGTSGCSTRRLCQEAANNGELTIYVGGEERWVERATPALRAFGRKIIHVGAIGSGQIAKTMNNLLLWACMCANFEVLTLAKSLGSDVPRLVDALNQGSGANWSLSRWGTGTGKWAEKDMDVALDIAQHAKVPMPVAGLVDQLVKTINQEKMKALLA